MLIRDYEALHRHNFYEPDLHCALGGPIPRVFTAYQGRLVLLFLCR